MKTLNLEKMKKPALGVILAMIIGTASIAKDNAGFGNSTDMTEEAEMIEYWMSDLSSWNSLKSSAFLVDHETELDLEVWMTDLKSDAWCSDGEEPLEVEDWMTKIADNNWEVEDPEDELSLEDWMLYPSAWLE